MKFLIYCQHTSPRLKYILDFYFEKTWQWDYTLTDSIDEFNSSHDHKISYGSKAISDEIFIYSDGLLFEDKIRDVSPDVFLWEDVKAFFKAPEEAAVPFDIFSASFYLLSRYEEYLPFKPDEHGRFSAENSFSFKNDFLNDPVIDIWSFKIASIFTKKFNIPSPSFQFTFTSTIDIDNAYAFLGKGFLRTIAALGKSAVMLKQNEFVDRISVMIRRQKDPYDTYNILDRWHKNYNVKTIYFFLLGNYAQYDKNLPVNSLRLRKLIKRTSDNSLIGIHPSYNSNSNPAKMLIEKEKLEEISLHQIDNSRQHFLKLEFPGTYRSLIDIEIGNDHTMGYADQIGFRAGTSREFYFYDLEREQSTKLLIHPFSVMDATLNRYMKISPDAAVYTVRPLVNKLKKYGGQFTLLWHNETLSEMHYWKGWRDVYLQLIKIAQND
ncbi:MAG: hypothetical protein HKN22_03770 [Bacteroidia bacterium]|nr:hypothetical protein [Bacteroidia bacterium]